MSSASSPGYVDDHLHLLACAAVRRSVDVSTAASIRELLAAIGRAAVSGTDEWMRVWGYDDALLVERRHPTVAELDDVTSGRPAVLHHITGHVCVVNTAAAHALGLPSGDVLTERHDLLTVIPRPPRGEVVAAVAEVLADLERSDITACTDATHTNDLASLQLLADAAAMVPSVAVTAMVGADRLDTLNGLSFGATIPISDIGDDEFAGGDFSRDDPASASGAVRIGHAKVMPAHDDDSSIDGLVAGAREHGFPVAVHVMDIDTLQATLDALEAHRPIGTAPDRVERDRIEHCALALPEQLDRIARLGIGVVTQPSFVTRREQKYREQLSVTEHTWLWPLASLLRRGIEVTLASDAPTTPADPDEWIAAATSRDLGVAERVDASTARRLCQRR